MLAEIGLLLGAACMQEPAAAEAAAAAAGTARWQEETPAGAALWASGSGINLRSEPAEGAPVAAQLPLGAPVEVVAAAPGSLTLGERTAPWVQVRAGETRGYVWAGALTAAREARDLDGDGSEEVATLSWRADRRLVLRASPAGAPASAVQELDLGEFRDYGGPLEEAQLSWLPADQAGVPLLKIYVPGREMCGSGTWTRYVHWDGARLSLALSEDYWTDSPFSAGDAVTFDPSARRAARVHTQTEDGETEQITTTILAWDGRAFTPAGEPTVQTRRVQQ